MLVYRGAMLAWRLCAMSVLRDAMRLTIGAAFLVVTACSSTNGAPGANGHNSLVRVVDASPASCPSGGKAIQTGVDDDDDGTLAASEVDATTPVCNGSNGTRSLIASTPASNAECPAGGTRVDSGLDDGAGGGVADDGVLQPGEVDATALVCNGTNGTNGIGTLVVVTDAGPADCQAGGKRLDTGLDDGAGGGIAADGVLQPGEIDATSFVCNGTNGLNGANGTGSLVSVSSAGTADCAAGGRRIDIGLDDGSGGGIAGDGLLQPGEVDDTSFVCNGTNGMNGANAPLPPGPCTGPWQVLVWNGVDYSCRDLRASGFSAGNANGFEVVDPWGTAWDGFARSASSWAAAKALCESKGGRLPFANELGRNNASTGTGIMGNSSDLLWTLLHVGAPLRVTVRLSDQGVQLQLATSPARFRCAWPSSNPAAFSGARCFGPPGSECFALGQSNMDRLDRLPLPYTIALQECAGQGAALPSMPSLVRAVRAGLPSGSNNSLWTASHQGQSGGTNQMGTVRWTDVASNFLADAPEVSAALISGFLPFRCVGPSTVRNANLAAPGNAFAGANSRVLFASADQGPGTFLEAVAACRAAGAHLPRQAELALAVGAGLPNGTGAPNITGEIVAGTNMGSVSWAGTNPFALDEGQPYGRDFPNPYPYRCAWYPLNPSFVPPTTCTGGCYTSTVSAAGVPATLVADSTNRPAALWAVAVQTCADLGGRLASHRDYAELILSGLPNGSGPYVWAADRSTPGAAHAVFWYGVETTWSTASYIEVAGPSTVSLPYRCVWGNELVD